MLRYKTETRPGLVALYDIRPGNGAGPFLQPRSPHRAWWWWWFGCCRCLHHKPEEDVGEAAVCSKSNSSDWEPVRRVRHLGSAVRTARRPQVCFSHWRYSDCGPLHTGNVHQSDPGCRPFCASLFASLCFVSLLHWGCFPGFDTADWCTGWAKINRTVLQSR